MELKRVIRWAPFALPLLVLPWIWRLLAAYWDAPLSRDVGMFRLTGWSVRHGLRLYSEVITPDGPFIHFMNAAIGALTDGSERGFRQFDFAVHGLVGGAIGMLIAQHAGRREWLLRASWGVALATLTACHLLRLESYEGGQREIYYASFGHLGMALLYVGSQWKRRWGRGALVIGGALVGTELLGKPTGIIFLVLGAVSVWFCDNHEFSRKQRIAALSIGAVGGVTALLAATAVWGSLSGFLRWYFAYPFVVYRFFAWHSLGEMLALAGWSRLVSAIVCPIVGSVAIRLGLLPRRSWVLLLLPAAHLVAAIAQRKGWDYHFLPIEFATDVVLVMLVFAIVAAEKRSLAAWAGLAVLGVRSLVFVALSPFKEANPYPAERATRSAAYILRAVTSPEARVFYLGEDSQLLLFAKRAPANPYLMTFFLDYSFARPIPSIDAFQASVRSDACARLAAWPEAIVTGPSFSMDAERSLKRVCPVESAELLERYDASENIKGIRIYVRKR